jgi:PAS domain S-box-containing protein
MLRVIACITDNHDLRLVVVAAVICLTATLAAVSLYKRANEEQRAGRVGWLILSGLAAGTGIWSTHFIAMLAFEPAIPVAYDLGGTVASLLMGVSFTATAFIISAPASRSRQVAGGAVFALGIGSMHWQGMQAFHPQGLVAYDPGMVSASLALGLVLAVAAMIAFDAKIRLRQWGAAGLLTLAICSLHFIAMAAATITPDPTVVIPEALLDRPQMAVGVVALAATLLIGAAALLTQDLRGRRASAKQMSLLFAANPVPMWVMESDTLKIIAANDAAARVYGYGVAEFERLSAFDLIHPTEHGSLNAFLNSKATAYDGERNWRHVRADGAELLMQPVAQSVDWGGRKVLLSAFFDVTVRERASEALLRAKDAAEAASRAKTEFLANMSHEIRTPLNGVLGVAGALEHTVLEPFQKEMVSIIQSSASVLERMLTDVLDTARIESEGVCIEAKPFDLTTAARETAQLFAPRAQEKGIALEIDLEAAPQGLVMGDQDRVRQILTNLLSNAVKFTEAGQVRLKVAAVEGGRVRLAVTDTGIGFDAAFGARMFNRFEQADSSITRRYGGSGLGLSIAKGLAERMGGDLTATAEPGKGAAFVLELPLVVCGAAAPAAPKVKVADRLTEGRRLRVLATDDHPVNRRVVELIIGPHVDLTFAEDGQQAVDAHASQVFDLILMDIQMPVMDGVEAIRLIRAREAAAGRRTPLYVLSASTDPSHREDAREAGADGHLRKPITADELLNLVAALSNDPVRVDADQAAA